MSRQEAEYYNTKIIGKNFESMQLLLSTDLIAPKVKKENTESFN